MPVSERERVAHVFRRLSMGVQADLALSVASPGAAIARCLDLGGAPAVPPTLPAPTPAVKPRPRAELERMGDALTWWVARMASPEQMIAERLVWFWTDHFAINMQKVRSADLVWAYHATIRRHATGSFAELLHAVAKSGAMLVFLDGSQNAAKQRNENFAREVMELHTLGRDRYTQDDVVAAARSFTGWVPQLPYQPATERNAPAAVPEFGSYLIARRHDDGTKTLLGSTGNFGLDDALDVILAQPAAARFIAAKLYRALVGAQADVATIDTLAARFRPDWSIMTLVHDIVARPEFVADAAVRTIPRSPLEKLVGLAQATGTARVKIRPALAVLRTLGYLPFFAPNPAGYPSGTALYGPQQLLQTFDLAAAVDVGAARSSTDVLERFGVFDPSPSTRAVIARTTEPKRRTLLALGSPEFGLR